MEMFPVPTLKHFQYILEVDKGVNKMNQMTKYFDGYSTCDVCNKIGSFNYGSVGESLYGFSGFTQSELNEIGLNHLDCNNDNVRCDDCLMINKNKKGVKYDNRTKNK